MKVKYSLEVEDKIVACVDCKHYLYNWRMKISGIDPRCLRTDRPTIDLVTGKKDEINVRRLDRCKDERSDEYSNLCGPDGIYWSPKHPTPENTMRVLKRSGNPDLSLNIMK